MAIKTSSSSSESTANDNFTVLAPAIAASLIVASLVGFLALKFSSITSFPELIAGLAALHGFKKSGDFLFVPAVAVTFTSSFIALRYLGNKISNLNEELTLASFTGLMGLVPPLVFGNWSLGADHQICIMLSFASSWIILAATESIVKLKLNQVYITATRPLITTAVLLSSIPIAFGLFISRFFFAIDIPWIDKIAEHYDDIFYFAVGLSIITVILWKNDYLTKYAIVIAKFSQIALPLFLALLIPPTFIDLQGQGLGFPCFSLKLVICGAIAICCIYLLLQALRTLLTLDIKNFASIDHHSRGLLPNISIYLILVILWFGKNYLPIIFDDDYHFGEQILGNWLYSLGKLPYVDYIPAHGVLVDDLISFLNNLFFEGKVATFLYAANITKAIVGFALFWALIRVGFQRIFAIFSCLVLTNVSEYVSWPAFIPLIISILARSCFDHKPKKWLLVWLPIVTFLIPGIPGQGLMIIISSLPLAGYHALRLYKSQGISGFSLVAYAGAGLLVLISAIDYRIWIGAVEYILTQGPINTAAYSLPWSTVTPISFATLSLELLRNSWILVVIGMTVAVTYKTFAVFKTKAHDLSLYQILICLGFLFLIVPYAMGRIDAGSLSRPGIISGISLAFFIPFLLSRTQLTQATQGLIIMPSLIVANLLHGGLDLTHLPSTLESPIKVSRFIDHDAEGIAGIGTGLANPEHFQMLKTVKRFLDKQLAPNETFIDLNNRNAWYRYFEKVPPVFVTANYNMASHKQQLRAIAELKANPNVAIALFHLFPKRYDTVGFPFRTPLLFRYLFDNFKIKQYRDSWLYGVRRRNGDDGANDDFTLWDQVVAPSEIANMPATWGYSRDKILKNYNFKLLEKSPELNHILVENDGYYRAMHPKPIALEFRGVTIEPEVDYLTFDFECLSGYDKVGMQLSWKKSNLEGSLTFQSDINVVKSAIRYPLGTNFKHTMLIPTFIYPRWFTRGAIEDLTISLVGCERFTLGDIRLYHKQ